MIEFVSLSDADECAPYSGQSGAYQNIDGVPAERVTVGTHLNAKLAELAVIGGVEEAGQGNQQTRYIKHSRGPFRCQQPHLDTELFLLRFPSFVESDDRTRLNTLIPIAETSQPRARPSSMLPLQPPLR